MTLQSAALASAQLLLADAGVERLDVLLHGLQPGVAVLLLEPGHPPWPALSRLASCSQLRTLHLLGHGRPGSIRLGRSTISQRQLKLLPPLPPGWKLSTLCLWSCGSGRGSQGQRFLQALADYTGACVHASEGPVGHAARGGDWQLNVHALPSSGIRGSPHRSDRIAQLQAEPP